MADHAFDLLSYAEEMNPSLAMVFAYRGAILLTRDDYDAARDAATRALDLDPYHDLAIEVLDSVG